MLHTYNTLRSLNTSQAFAAPFFSTANYFILPTRVVKYMACRQLSDQQINQSSIINQLLFLKHDITPEGVQSALHRSYLTSDFAKV